MTFPTRWTVGVRRYESTSQDAHGNPVVTHSATALDLPVHFVAPATAVEPYRANRDLSTSDLAVGCPKSDDLPAPADLVVWQGEDYTVEGEVADFSFGPFNNTSPVVTFLIRRVEG